MPTRISKETAARVAAAWPNILERVAAGERYSVILDAHGLTYDQMRGYRDSDPELRAEWESARKDSAGALVDQMIDTINNSDVDPSRARVRLETLKFLIERLDPERFSPRTRADINVKTVDLTRTLIAADKRARLAQQERIGRTISGECERVIVNDALRINALPEGE